MTQYQIDLTKLEDIHCGHIYYQLPTVNDLLTEVVIRAQASRMHCTQASGDVRRYSAFVRAALADFVSIEEAAKRDLKSLEIPAKSVRIESTNSPLLIVMKELRNMEMHVATSNIKYEEKEMQLGDMSSPESAKALKMRIFFIDRLSMSTFRTLNAFTKKSRGCIKYNKEDFTIALDWFDSSQKNWGVTEMIYRGVCEYLEYLSILADREQSKNTV